jgi:predicted MPP superfamily phosphohydrolase
MSNVPLSMDILYIAAQAMVIASQIHPFLWLRRAAMNRQSRWRSWGSWAFLLAGLALAGSVDLLAWDRFVFPGRAPLSWRFAAAIWIAGSMGAYLLLLAQRALQRLKKRPAKPLAQRTPAGEHSMTRRQLTSAAARAALAAPFAAAGYGTFIGRTQFELREVDLAMPALPEALEGLRIAQLTDIHCGPFLSLREVETVVGMVNETRPHLAVVTGDLITRPEDPLRKCLETLRGIQAEAGIYHCLGNHEVFAHAERFVEELGQSLGMEVLRKRSSLLRFGDARLNLCGVDYQRKHLPYLENAETMLDPLAFNVLLTHNPDVFPVAAAMGYDLVIGGHTHGGQVTMEIVEQWVNAGRFFTPFVAGAYRLANSALYVSRGIGTINLPMRVGALPEITLLRLRRA